MTIDRIADLGLEDVVDKEYDLALLASGYERRCTHIPEKLREALISKTVVLGFRDVADEMVRKQNDEYFDKNWKKEPITVGANDDAAIYAQLAETIPADKENLQIVVDYSSMSRLWYAALLNWARYACQAKSLTIDFLYSVGRYPEEIAPMVIEDMLSVPGCEGAALPQAKSVAVFGLGFYGYAALCVLDRLEADDVFAFLAAPAYSLTYGAKIRQANKDLIEDYHTKMVLELPLGSVETAYRYLSELITPFRPTAEIVLVPMGPKPHVLASILVAMKFPDVACLRISARRERPEEVDAEGSIVATRVTFRLDRA